MLTLHLQASSLQVRECLGRAHTAKIDEVQYKMAHASAGIMQIQALKKITT